MKLLKCLLLVSFFAINVCCASDTTVVINNIDYQGGMSGVKGHLLYGMIGSVEEKESGAGGFPPAMTVYGPFTESKEMMKYQIPSPKKQSVIRIDNEIVASKGFCFWLGIYDDTGTTPCEFGDFVLEGKKVKNIVVDIRGGHFMHPYSQGTMNYKCVVSDVKYITED